mmetsp:Transcript_100823/g.291535  ORF Transcript_100823/g.291535 Transcript_100823/m.291535 type:complete len:200 (-) Transcript_100823:204-803(-)
MLFPGGRVPDPRGDRVIPGGLPWYRPRGQEHARWRALAHDRRVDQVHGPPGAASLRLRNACDKGGVGDLCARAACRLLWHDDLPRLQPRAADAQRRPDSRLALRPVYGRGGHGLLRTAVLHRFLRHLPRHVGVRQRLGAVLRLRLVRGRDRCSGPPGGDRPPLSCAVLAPACRSRRGLRGGLRRGLFSGLLCLRRRRSC